MKYFFLLLGYTLFFGHFSYSQNNLAILKYEEAEVAFGRADYAKTIQLVDEVEQIAGITSGTLYLRIVAQDKLFKASPNGELNDSEKTLLSRLRKHAKQYLDAMQEQELDDNFRTVYRISEKLKKYVEFVSPVSVVLEKYYEALGGRERIGTVQTVIKKCETTTITMGTEATNTFLEKITIGKSRVEMKGEGFASLVIYNNPQSIAYTSFDMGAAGTTRTNVEVTEGLERKTRDSQALVCGELLQSERYVDAKVEESILEGEVVSVLHGNQQVAVFSRNSGLLLSVVEYSIPNVEITYFFKDYQKINGLLFPFSIEFHSKTKIEGMEMVETTGRTVYSEVLVNEAIPETEFR